MTGLEGIERRTDKHEKGNCKGCIYLSAKEWCDYGEMTGRSRYVDGGKLSPGGGCSLYTTGHRNIDKSPWTPYVKNKAIETVRKKEIKPLKPKRQQSVHAKEFEYYYNMGLPDRKVAELVGCGKTAVQRWRKRNDLISNGEKARRIGKKVL